MYGEHPSHVNVSLKQNRAVLSIWGLEKKSHSFEERSPKYECNIFCHKNVLSDLIPCTFSIFADYGGSMNTKRVVALAHRIWLVHGIDKYAFLILIEFISKA